MEKLGRPRGLIRYDSLAGLALQRHRIVRPRVLLYTGVLALLLGVFVIKLTARDALSITVTRMAGIPYLVQSDGLVRNVFNLTVTNTEAVTRTVSFQVSGSDGLQLLVPGQPVAVAAGERITAEAFVMLPQQKITSAETPIAFSLISSGDSVSGARAVFLGPVYHAEHQEHDDEEIDHD
jgi:polyferredoxin